MKSVKGLARKTKQPHSSFLMGNRLYVANLSYQTSESELEEVFQQAGTVSSVQIVMDRDTNRSRGFGFITMGSDAEAEAAIEQLNGKDLGGRELRVSEARPREDRPPQKRSFGGGGDRGDRGDRGGKGYDRGDRKRY
jgi:RNA recognition motif-containing protein